MLTGCAGSVGPQAGTAIALQHSQLLHIEQHEGYRLVSITDPWRDNALLHLYALVPRSSSAKADGIWSGEEPLPLGIPEQATVVRTPLRKMCVSTSVHAALMDDLGALDCVGSICEGKYILTPAVQERLRGRRIKDVGSGLNPNVERIVQLQTDALLMSPFEGASYGLLEKTGIPIIECADYMETTALGRAEWMKFYGMLVDREAEADSLFDEIVSHYDSLKVLAANAKHHPKLLADMLNGNTWYLPGGGSTYGALYKDAGADFSIASDEVSGSQPLSLEKVLVDGKDADVWIIKYSRPTDFTYATLLHENPIYEKFAAYRQRNIYGCNAYLVPFYEEVPFRPDLLLADIISILHPDLLPNHQRVFYQPLKEK